MATTPDLEKRAILAAAVDDSDAQPAPASPPRSRIRPWLFVLVGALVVLSIGATSHRCFADTSLFTTTHGVSRAGGHAHQHGIKPQAVNSRSPTTSATTSAAAPSRTVLKTFEVAQPVLMPDGPAESDGSTRDRKDYTPELCSVLLMRHDFAWSYNAPFVGNYTPPSCDFNRVVLNFSVVSQGRQFDRLAIMYFGDTEVWRTSTAEPTSPPGISWIYLKDMTEYLYFWKSPQKLIFDLGNLIDDKYTGIFNTTMTAIFYKADVETDQAPPSDLIIPISSRHSASNSVSLFVLPAENATNTISLPRNIRRAVFSVSANGQATEEFWWSNVLQSDVSTFNKTAGELPGLSPFREVQVLIDGQLAGVQWPFPVIFTGGVVPSLHRPIVGIHAFDLREHEIDITPFLPLLCDGQQHTFTIRVAGLDVAGDSSSTSAALTESVNESWYVTGKLFLWLDDDPSSITTGSAPSVNLSPPTIVVTRAVTTDVNGTNETLTYTTSVQRALKITTADLRTQNSSAFSSPSPATWSQSLTYTNRGRVTDFGFTQINDMLIKGTDRATLPSSHPHPHHQPDYTATYAYPLFCNSTYAVSPQGNLSISAFLRQGKEVSVAGPSVFPSGLEAFSGKGGSGKGLVRRLETSKEGTAEFRQTGDGKASSGWGEARQVFWFGVAGEGGKEGEELYFREVEAVNGTVVGDVKRLAGRRVEVDVPGLRGGGKGVVSVGATEYA
ncbi:peptide N-acetyl-beta-D-glucosaminyl asparaginase amidase A-domain-containing protein [Staphylotrichum tortipilum]|uniref:Peptide N-acetyl-beta-D-glucosaminyl asparaginase amidase A-domain-containing protein n=1 Tax=Staphylotrichum tortipilum TaxID=2831512 RepID=A0AAN6MCT4_9PEZI|nr:peptide N-acetyl-beta-D-glucosaminyl asparaginase amidase A-domain-containing protein [Staphylotrichum longicolle]